jgi:hypothetical protein
MGELLRIEPETGIVLLGNEGPLTYEGWEREVLGLLRAVPNPGARRRILSDRRRTAPLSYELVDRILTFYRQRAAELGEVQWALLGSAKSQVYEVLRLGEALASTPHVRVKAFSDLAPALGWLLGAYEAEELARLERWVEQT